MNIQTLLSDAQRKLNSKSDVIKVAEAKGILRSLRTIFGDITIRECVLGTNTLADPSDLAMKADKYLVVLNRDKHTSSKSLNKVFLGRGTSQISNFANHHLSLPPISQATPSPLQAIPGHPGHPQPSF